MPDLDFKHSLPNYTYCLDYVRVAVAYYIGTERRFKGILPLIILAFVVFISVIISETVVRKKKNRINPAQSTTTGGSSISNTNMVIMNLIPFMKLNFIFAFGIVLRAVVSYYATSQIGLPKLSIQIDVCLLLLVATNSGAKAHFKRKISAWWGFKVDSLKSTPQQQATENQQPTNRFIPSRNCHKTKDFVIIYSPKAQNQIND